MLFASPFPVWLWFLIVAGGGLVLGIVIAYGAIQYLRRKPSDDALAEQGARRVYQERDRPDLAD